MTQVTEVNGIQLAYSKSGKGKPLLLLHGWTQSSAFWQSYIPQYAHEFEVYTIDLRGHGKSTPLTEDFSIKKAAQDIALFITKLGLTQVGAIGFSYGGLVLLELENSHPGLLEKMVLVGTTNQYNGKDLQHNKPVFTYERLDPGFKHYLNTQHAHGESQISALFNKDLDYQIAIGPEELKKFRADVLLMNGDTDEFAGIAGAIEMHRHIPRSALWIMPQTGHMAIGETPSEAFIHTTRVFLTEGITSK